jgi:hypothetical protein
MLRLYYTTASPKTVERDVTQSGVKGRHAQKTQLLKRHVFGQGQSAADAIEPSLKSFGGLAPRQTIFTLVVHSSSRAFYTRRARDGVFKNADSHVGLFLTGLRRVVARERLIQWECEAHLTI